jgi:hypothetical protein
LSRSPLDIDDLIGHWTLLPDELDLVVRRHEPTRLAFATWLKFYTHHGRFPRGRSELHDDATRVPEYSKADALQRMIQWCHAAGRDTYDPDAHARDDAAVR